MPIQSYHGETFVAFIDISGFKAMMKNREFARNALSTFFQTGYSVLRGQMNSPEIENINGIFISDCGILFSRFNGEINNNIEDKAQALKSLLLVIEEISRTVINADIMLTASISYGRFDYSQTIEFNAIEKNLLFGFAYLNAFLDNDSGKPKIEPGQ
jgi:hypothetical protein